jgi:hypothetical protein
MTRKRSPVPPMLGERPPLPPGAAEMLAQQPRRVVMKTQHITQFMGCTAMFAAILDDNNVVQGYRFQIHDPAEGHTYNFDFGKELLEEFTRDLNGFPAMGHEAEPTKDDRILQ